MLLTFVGRRCIIYGEKDAKTALIKANSNEKTFFQKRYMKGKNTNE